MSRGFTIRGSRRYVTTTTCMSAIGSTIRAEAHLTERDSIIFQESDVEVFIDGGDAYYELEINALGTLHEVSSSGAMRIHTGVASIC